MAREGKFRSQGPIFLNISFRALNIRNLRMPGFWYPYVYVILKKFPRGRKSRIGLNSGIGFLKSNQPNMRRDASPRYLLKYSGELFVRYVCSWHGGFLQCQCGPEYGAKDRLDRSCRDFFLHQGWYDIIAVIKSTYSSTKTPTRGPFEVDGGVVEFCRSFHSFL